eukprot:gene8112-8306_t
MVKRPPERRLRVYEQWQGNERFFCYGHCVTGPSWKSGLGSLVLLIGPTVIFLVFVAPYMAVRVSPAIMVVSCLLPLFCVSMLLMTSCRDPGVLPRQEPDEEWLQGRKPRAKDVCVNGHRVTVRYNDTCHFYQPPRAHHCSVNDNCIERFDHHCPWVGTTIGKRNYRTFLLFIYGTSVYIAWTFGVSIGSLFVRHSELVRQQQQTGEAGLDNGSGNLWLTTLSQSGAALALMVFTFIFFWFVCGLSSFHTWLVATNQTTYENFRYNHNQVPNPYNEGLFRNCASVWLKPIPPSKVQFRAYLDEVVVQPVELGFMEWGNSCTVPAPPVAAANAGSNIVPRPEQVAGTTAPSAAVAAINQSSTGNDNKPWLVGNGDGTAVPVQGDDSVTEAPSPEPVSRSARNSSGHGGGTAVGTTGAASDEYIFIEMAHAPKPWEEGSDVCQQHYQQQQHAVDGDSRGAALSQPQQHGACDRLEGGTLSQASVYEEVRALDSSSGCAQDDGAAAVTSNGNSAGSADSGAAPDPANRSGHGKGWKWMRGSSRQGQ